jgi:hypothetical protein
MMSCNQDKNELQGCRTTIIASVITVIAVAILIYLMVKL